MLARILLINVILLFCICVEAKILRIAGLEVYPHVKFNKETKMPEGFASAFLEKHLGPGLKSKFDMHLEWSQAPPTRLAKDLEAHQLDVLFFLLKTPEREKKYIYSKKPYVVENAGMIVNKDFTKQSELKNYDLFKNKTITFMTGILVPDFIKENNIEILTLDEYTISDKALRLVAANKLDGIFIYSESAAKSLVRNYKFEDTLKVVQLPLKSELYIVYSKKLDPNIQKYVDEVLLQHRKEYLELMNKN